MDDLHHAKRSHMSVPVTKGIEFHLKKTDYKDLDCEVGEHYCICIPMVCTSEEGDSYRYKQEGKIEVNDADWEKMALEEMRKKIGVKED
jgi:hypothetical protein